MPPKRWMNCGALWLGFVVMVCMTTSTIASAQGRIVTTVAGGYIGDGKAAPSADFAFPTSVAHDAKGNVYVSDSYDCRIRKINSVGIISTFAGTGICGYSGDGGPATSARIYNPYALAFDAVGNLLFADQGNNRIREITPGGTISTVAGNGTFGYSGDGGPATKASLAAPIGVTTGPSGTIYISDTNNAVVRRVDAAGNIQTVAGNHTAGFSGDGGPATSAEINYPNGIVVDASGNLYVSDTFNERVRKVDTAGNINTFAGNGSGGNTGSGGPATSASIGEPLGLMLASAGRLFISTPGNIWSVTLSTNVIKIVAGNAFGITGYNGDGGVATSTDFGSVQAMAPDSSGGIIVADGANNRVRHISGSSRVVTTISGGRTGDGGPASAASLNLYQPGHLAFDSAGNLYLAENFSNRVRKITPTGGITTVAGTGIAGYTGDGGPATHATLTNPRAVAVDGSGNIFIADGGNGVIRKIDSTGTISTFSTVQIFGQAALAVDASGNLYASDGLWAVWKILPSGSASIVAGVQFSIGYNGDGIPATQAWLYLPNGVAVDHAGNLYISDWLNERIRKVDTSGMISTVAGNGTGGFSGDGGPATSAMISLPSDVAVDGVGTLYIADWINSRVRIVDHAGIIQTLAGSGNFGFNGDGRAARQTNLFPAGLAINSGGVYVSDQASYRVRRIH